MKMAAAVRATLLLVSLAAASGSKDAETPIQKVVNMLTSMREKGLADKKAEEEQYAAYLKFCQGSGTEKTSLLESSQHEVDSVKADILLAQTTAEMSGKEGEKLEADIAAWTKSAEAAKVARDAETDEYQRLHAGYTELIDAIVKAIDVLKKQAGAKVSSKAMSLLSKIEGAEVAEAQKILAAFLADYESEAELEEPEASTPAPATGMANIIDMLEKLRDKFVDERSAVEKKEQDKSQAFAAEAEDLKKSISDATAQKSDKVSAKAQALQDVATKNAQLQDVNSRIEALQQDSKDLDSACKLKASDFEQRQKVRADELAAIDKAVTILSGSEVQKVASKPTTLLQRVATALAALRSSKIGPSQMQVAEFLRDQAAKLDSRVLSVVAMKAAQDPFEKVRKMIQDLISRLEEEAVDEAKHESWCNTELAANEQTRTARSADVAKLTSQIDQATSNIAKLASDLEELAQRVEKNTKDVADMTKIREEEKATNEETVKDAKKAQEAVTQAVTILKEFYQGTGKASLIQASTKADPVPEPFKGAYSGMTESGTEVIGLLEVILSDFARLEAQTAASETTSQSRFESQLADMAAEKEQIQKEQEHKSRAKTLEEQALANLNTDLASAKSELEAAQKYFETLKPSCLDGGSAEERKLRRQEEIEALQEADKLLAGANTP